MYLILLAVLPAFILCGYVYIKDKVEKEPAGLLLCLLFMGALSCFPAMVIEIFLEEFYIEFFPFYEESTLLNFGYFFFVIALAEEGLKWLILVFTTSKNKEFNCLFDGLLYAIFISLGFAALENILYVIENGVAVGIMRAVLSVPGHMFFAVFMGIYYSEWQFKKRLLSVEEKLYKNGYIPKPETSFKADAVLSILIPVTIHAFYNHCCSSMDSGVVLIIFVALMVYLYIKGFATIRKKSKDDDYTLSSINKILFKKYPQLLDCDINEEMFEINI